MADRKSFLLRTDARTLDLLKGWANDEFRSLNSQIEYLLKRALKGAGRWKPLTLGESGSSTPTKEDVDSPQNTEIQDLESGID
jgi:hypothetical protein